MSYGYRDCWPTLSQVYLAKIIFSLIIKLHVVYRYFFFYFNYFVFHFLWFLELSEELQQLQEMARKFSHEEIVPFAAEYDKTGEVKREFIYFTLYIVHVVCLLLHSFLFC